MLNTDFNFCCAGTSKIEVRIKTILVPIFAPTQTMLYLFRFEESRIAFSIKTIDSTVRLKFKFVSVPHICINERWKLFKKIWIRRIVGVHTCIVGICSQLNFLLVFGLAPDKTIRWHMYVLVAASFAIELIFNTD